MPTLEVSAVDQAGSPGVARRLSMLDRLLPLWILLAMALGLGLGAIAPGIKGVFNALSIGTVSLPLTAALAHERGVIKPGHRVGFLGIGSGLNCLMLGLEW